MENEILIQVEQLSKKFCKDLKMSLWYGLKDVFSRVSGDNNERVLRPKEFWAVKDVSFELRRGECIGLIGHNGAGKSTLLKILNGLINPDAGKVTIKGRVGALIELGAGFNPILSGRENIYNNGAILGFSREEINTKMENIIEFAELSEFIDMPVQHYSSGMKMRLGFAIAIQMEPDVLIIDEVLAVGDLGFIMKCFKAIDDILPSTAIVFVSHSMYLVSRVCNQILLLEKGIAKFQGEEVAKGIDLYYARFSNNEQSTLYTDGSIKLLEAKVLNELKIVNKIPLLNWGSKLELFFKFKLSSEIERIPVFFVVIVDKEQRPVATLDPNKESSELKINNNIIEFVAINNKIELSKGVYTIDILLQKTLKKNIYLSLKGVLTFQVLHEMDIYPPFLLESQFNNIAE